MTTMTFGRVGLPTNRGGGATPFTMGAPTSWSSSGSSVTVQGVQYQTGWTSDSRAALLAWREAMLAYTPELATQEEPIVPVTIADAPQFDGWYQVESISIPLEPGTVGTSAATGYLALPWSAQLVEVANHQMPLLEGKVNASPYTPTYTTCNTMVAVPNTTGNRWSLTATETVGVAEGGSVSRYTIPASSSTFIHRFNLRALDAYIGAARVQDVIGGYDMPVVGQKTWDYGTVGSSVLTGISISNGLVRVAYDASLAPSTAAFNVAWWDGSVWDSTRAIPVFAESFDPWPPDMDAIELKIVGATVLRNTPECCTVRFSTSIQNFWSFPYAAITQTYDVTVRRGSRVVTFDRTGIDYGNHGLFMFMDARSLLNGSAIETSTNAQGNRLILSGLAGSSTDNAMEEQGFNYRRNFVGAEVGGATGYLSGAEQILEGYMATNEVVKVVRS